MVVRAGTEADDLELVRPEGGTSSPRIAVVIPCFNDGEFVAEAARSVQEAEPVEIVIVDDGSTDPGTKQVLADLQATGVARVVAHDANAGLSAARMTGVAVTSAAYVFPLDADDVLEPGSLASLADRLDADAEVAFTYGHGWYLHEDFGWNARPWDPFVLLYLNGWGPSCMVRRGALLAVGGWTLNDCYEDWDFLLGLAEHGYRGAPVDQLVLHYRRHLGARQNVRCLKRHGEVYRLLRARHAPLFARRAELAASSPMPWWQRFVLPIRHGARPLLPFRLYWWVRGRRTLRPRRL